MGYNFDIATMLPFWREFAGGLLATLEMTLVAVVLGLLVGIAVALARRSSNRVLYALASVYIEVFRNTPFIVQIFILYFGLSSIGIQISAIVAGMAAMTINVGSYTGEIIRAGLDNVPKGQIEAAECLGLPRYRIFLHVILIPALEDVYPALTGQFVLMMLMSSVTSQISAEELSAVAYNIQSSTFRSMEVYLTVAVIYCLTGILIKFLFYLAGEVVFRHRRIVRCSSVSATRSAPKMEAGA